MTKPTAILKLAGAYKKDPKRGLERENEPVSKIPIGNPSKKLDQEEKTTYKEIVKICIDGVLFDSDRIAVECAAKLLVKIRNDEADNSEQNLFFKYLGQLGMSPTERRKISVEKVNKKSVFDE